MWITPTHSIMITVAHHVAQLELGQRQRRQDPEGLHQVVPGVAQHHGHGGLVQRAADFLGGVDHEWTLDHQADGAKKLMTKELIRPQKGSVSGVATSTKIFEMVVTRPEAAMMAMMPA